MAWEKEGGADLPVEDQTQREQQVSYVTSRLCCLNTGYDEMCECSSKHDETP